MSESTEAAERWRSGQRPPKAQRRARKMDRALPPPISDVLKDRDEALTDAAREIGRRGVASLREALSGAERGTECE